MSDDKPISFLKFLSQQNMNGCNHDTFEGLLNCKEKECSNSQKVMNAVVHRFINSGFGKHNPLNEVEKILLENILCANISMKLDHILLIVYSALTRFGTTSKRSRGKLRDLWDIDQFLDESISGNIDGIKNSIGFVLTNALVTKLNEWSRIQHEKEEGSDAKNL